MSALAQELRALIAAEGPLSVARWMALCLTHPRHGYYVTRDPLGRDGDFTTAPEISQMFGELIGLWAAAVWQAMGAPARLRLVELGPGRGTLMADALRAARALPPFRAALAVHLVEASPVLRERQRGALAGTSVPVAWHDRLEDLPDGPAILIANEFFDALPVRQYVRTERGWCERLVGLDAQGRFALGLAPEPEPALTAPGPAGAVLEWPAAALEAVSAIAGRLAREGGAALLIDYGSARSGFGDTLQAVRRHAFADPWSDPGEADLTVHVDFARLAAAARAAGAAVHGPTTQGAFLDALGLPARTERLKRGADAEQAAALDAARDRLAGPGPSGMGELFKVLAITDPRLPAPPGFDPGAPMTRDPAKAAPPALQAPTLAALPGMRHAFFTREGGVSEGLYASLNGGLGSDDDQARVVENRRRMADRIGVDADALVSLYQVHSAQAVIVEAPWAPGERPRADAMATRRPGLALGIATADCGPVLFADPEARVVGAAHAGWKGALGGVLEAALGAMEELGARRERVVAVLGPTIGQASYEVGPELLERFVASDPANARFFRPSPRADHHLFDLPAYIGARLRGLGVASFEDLALCTYADAARFYSYRRTTHRGERDYGRLISAIALEG